MSFLEYWRMWALAILIVPMTLLCVGSALTTLERRAEKIGDVPFVILALLATAAATAFPALVHYLLSETLL